MKWKFQLEFYFFPTFGIEHFFAPTIVFLPSVVYEVRISLYEGILILNINHHFKNKLIMERNLRVWIVSQINDGMNIVIKY